MAEYVQGALSEQEKKDIIYMLFYQNRTISQISEALNRNPANEAMKSFIKKIKRNVSQIGSEHESLFAETIKRLVSQGLTKHMAVKLVASCLESIKDIVDPKEASDLIMNGSRFSDLFLSRTNNDKGNIVVMNEMSSQKADSVRRTGSPREQEAIYKIKK